MVGYYSLSKWTWVHKKWKWGMSITNLFEFEDTARYTTLHYTSVSGTGNFIQRELKTTVKCQLNWSDKSLWSF